MKKTNRREFLQLTASTALAKNLTWLDSFTGRSAMGLVVHSYATRYNGKYESANYPPFKNALDFLEHAYKINAGGIQTYLEDWSADMAGQLRNKSEAYGMYIEGSIGLPKTQNEIGAFEQKMVKAKSAGVSIVRTVCLSSRRYETFQSREAFDQFKAQSLASIRSVIPILEKTKIKLAIENHKDWLSADLASIIRDFNHPLLGVTVDFGNNIALLEHPDEVIKNLAPLAFSTHIKDMAVHQYEDGFLLAEVPLGQGMLDLPAMVKQCKKQNKKIRFNLEMITRDPLEIPCNKESYWASFGPKDTSQLDKMYRFISDHSQKNDLPKIAHLPSEDKLMIEEENNLKSLAYSQQTLKLK
jgi:3-oxoisoapionate decarboxylase